MVKPWYGQNSLWQKITRSNGSGQTAPSRNRFRSKYGQTLSGQMRSNIIWSKYGQTSNIIWSNIQHYLLKIRSNIIWSNAVKHYLRKIRSLFTVKHDLKCGQTLSGQNTVKHYLLRIRSIFIRSKAETAPGQPQNVPRPPFRAVKQNLAKPASGQNPGAGPKRSAAAAQGARARQLPRETGKKRGRETRRFRFRRREVKHTTGQIQF